ncbi:hypothetical protein MKX01_030325 [Papaver californicum]|nr:hypothetical protein MKX01_030325 [Papaver californicum]
MRGMVGVDEAWGGLKGKGSPVEGVVKPGSFITLPPPKEVARPELPKNSSPVGNLNEEEWVTVYGSLVLVHTIKPLEEYSWIFFVYESIVIPFPYYLTFGSISYPVMHVSFCSILKSLSSL